ncbi:MAG: YifB family Mg chelatase-like AAA ATPase [Proteobacteria bacterium]|nr:YifB family Mg chelatase-like AAA ATPase [Pseudomonadota bacterium]MCH8176612.1 YifB family Mg chelatase-like AAA ATPase [Pseudomonadota bacterium]
MSLTQLTTRAQEGIDAPEVRVEVHISIGLPAFTVVGLPEAAVREARDRVRSAIINSGFQFPMRRITVNLAPANLPKEGGRYDLSIALGILAASDQIDASTLGNYDCYGELALSGECRAVDGILPALIASKRANKQVIIPLANQAEATLVSGIPVFTSRSLVEVCTSLNGGPGLPLLDSPVAMAPLKFELDLSEVYGQHQAKRALEIAASGGHHMLMMGPPGTGKSMLAQRLNTILPPLSESEAMSSASIRSIGNKPVNSDNWLQRPFQSPHHTVSGVALVGGGSIPKPGEISLAHNGVLFLDELTEFGRKSIEALREPLETGKIHISRASRQAEFPAEFQLIAAMNPCPGGCESIQTCICSVEQLNRYRNKLSAPLLDRIDIQIELPRLEHDELLNHRNIARHSSELIRARVIRARSRQLERQNCLNARLSNHQIEQHCRLDEASETLLMTSIDRLRLTARSYHKLLKLARTIADLANEKDIRQAHIAESIAYRRPERHASNPYIA